MSATASVSVLPSPRSRSRLVNEPFRLPGVNGSSSQARYFRDLCIEYAVELGETDPSRLSEADLTLIRATAAMQVQLSNLQAAVVRGEPVDDEQFTRLSNSLTRSLVALRRRRRSSSGKDGSEDLQAYLTRRARERDAA